MAKPVPPRYVQALFLAVSLCGAARGAVISQVSVSPSFFNPSLGEKQEIHFRVARAGAVTVKILDRDRFPIRTLAPLEVTSGEVTTIWDGKDQSGEVVPDEAYNLRLEFIDGTSSETYDPSEHFRPLQE